MFFQSCVSHGLHLFVKDIFSAAKKKRSRLVADYPEGYPFKYILDFVHECKNVATFFHNHQALKEKTLFAIRILETHMNPRF